MEIPLDKAVEIIKRHQDAGNIIRTPLIRSGYLSEVLDSTVYLKLECLQRTGSFKVRGALVALEAAKSRGITGVITASAGNHAQGVAYASKLLGLEATIVMPLRTPWIKIYKTRGYGAKVLLRGETYQEAEREALRLSRDMGIPYVHAYDDPSVVAGQGTVGVEILEDLSGVDVVVVPVGGGGLISGVAYAVKRRNPSVKVVGVQPEGAPSAYVSLREGRIVSLDDVDTIAEGISVKKIGKLTFELMRTYVDDVVLISDADIVHAMYAMLEHGRVVVEAAGAASVAALISRKLDVSGKKVVAVLSGGNVDPTMLVRVVTREMARTGRLVRFRGEIPDVPGTLMRALSVLARHNINVVEIYHERYNPLQRPNYAYVVIVAEVPPEPGIMRSVMDGLNGLGYRFWVED